jgi:histidinol-phosphate/aromatic aminotransferase/cobyric acid decarboxylase-like protein
MAIMCSAAWRVNREGLEFLGGEFEKLGLAFVPSQANFVLVRVGQGPRSVSALLSQGVIVRPMGGYQFPEHFRVTGGHHGRESTVNRGIAKSHQEFPSSGSDHRSWQ